MKRIILFLILCCAVGDIYGQSKVKQLRLIVIIDDNICQDIINGKFVVKGKDSKTIDEMPFSSWVGKLEMTTSDYKKLFTVKPQDTLYLTFKNNNFALDTDYVYEGKIPKGMMNSEYLIFNICNEKNKESSEKYIFSGNNGYVVQVISPGYYTKLKMANKK